jgi:AcrR family transcriptional regulator
VRHCEYGLQCDTPLKKSKRLNMARRSEHSLEELKKLILDAAETIVIEEGFPALKVRKIAVEIGYTVGSIYMVFANMADLILHINARTLDAIAAQLEQVHDRKSEQSIETLARTYLSYASKNFNRWRNIFEFSLPADAEAPDWYQEKVDNVFTVVHVRFTELAPELSEDHRKRAAKALWCGVHGICMLSLTGKEDMAGINNIEETIVLLVRNFMRGWISGSNK